MRQLDSIGFNESSEDEAAKIPAPVPQPTKRAKGASTTRSVRNIPTIRSREAVAALSGAQSSVAPVRSANVPKAGVVSSLLMPKRKTRVPTNPSSMRDAAAVATSNTTVGYSKGRTVSSTLRDHIAAPQPRPQTTLSPETYMQLYGTPPLGSDMWTRCKAAGCFDVHDQVASPDLEEFLPTFEEDEEAESFQLTL